MDVIAHRGFADEAPENTVPTIRHAADHADVIEFDVRESASGDPVVIHDVTVDRVTDASGPVTEFTTAELASLDVLGSGAGVPTLREVVDEIPPDVGINAELKASGPLVEALSVLDDHEGDVVVSSFSTHVLTAVRERDPSVRTAFLPSRRETRPTTRAVELGCSNLHLHVRQCAIPRTVATARDVGLTVNVWGIERPLDVRAMALVGVDGVTVDSRAVL